LETRLDKYAVSPEQVVLLHSCLSSKLCMRIFNILLSERRHVNISAICRKAGCTSGNAVKHLRRLVKLGAAEESSFQAYTCSPLSVARWPNSFTKLKGFWRPRE